MADANVDTYEDPKYVLHRVKFGILLSLQIPSMLLCLLIFAFFFTHRALLRVRQNQALLLLLLVSPATPAYCTWWTFLEYSLNVGGEMLMATISIQRHILIFQGNILNVRFYRYVLHHIPLLLCIIYPIILYLAIIVFYPCDGTQWDYSSNVCGLTNCYMVYDKGLATFDWVVNNGLPIVVISLANLILFVRVIRQKLRRQGVVSWRKQRRMALQLLSISSLYIIAWFPSIFVAVVQYLVLPTFLLAVQVDYIFDLTYLVCLLVPWVCLGLFPEFTNWFWNVFLHRKGARNSVGPTKS